MAKAGRKRKRTQDDRQDHFHDENAYERTENQRQRTDALDPVNLF